LEAGSASKELRRLGWGLLAYGLLLLGLGIAVVRLAVTHRRFDRLTVTPEELQFEDTVPVPDGGQSPAEVRPVSSVAP
jgi:hypothetical protein